MTYDDVTDEEKTSFPSS